MRARAATGRPRARPGRRRGAAARIDIPFQTILDAPDEMITEAINKLADKSVKHMPRCKKGCNNEINP